MAKLVLLLVFVCFQFSKSEDLSAIEQIKLDLDEVPFNNQTGPDTELLDGADEDQWSSGPKINYNWLRGKSFSSEEALNSTDSNLQTILDKLAELAEMIKENSDEYSDEEYSDEDSSFDWDDDLYDDDDDEDYEYDPDFSYLDAIKDWIYNAKYESVKNKNGKEYVYNTMISLLRPTVPKGDKPGNNLNKELHPVKRFTSV